MIDWFIFIESRTEMTKRALISVSDKAGIVEFAQELKNLVGILSRLVEQKLRLIKQVLTLSRLMM